MHRINLLLHRMESEVGALLDLHAAEDLKTFWTRAGGVLHATLPIGGAWLWLCPELAAAGPGFQEEASCRSEAEFQEFVELHPAAAWLRAHPALAVARASDVAPEPQLRRMKFYRRFRVPQRDRHCAALAFWDHHALVGLIGLCRGAGAGDFSAAEMRLLQELHRQLAASLHRVLSLHRERCARRSLEAVFARLPVAIAVLNWGLEVVYCSRAARELAATWNLGRAQAWLTKSGSAEMPGEVREYCRRLQAAWLPEQRASTQASSGEVVASQDTPTAALRASIHLVPSPSTAGDAPVFLIVFDDHRQHGKPDGGTEGSSGLQLVGLTPREREVASLVCEGQSDQEVASALGKSIHTVKRQLRSIYRKLHVPSRHRLSALLRQ